MVVAETAAAQTCSAKLLGHTLPSEGFATGHRNSTTIREPTMERSTHSALNRTSETVVAFTTPEPSAVADERCEECLAANDPVDLLRQLFDQQAIMRKIPRIIGYMVGLPHRALRTSDTWIKDFGEFAFVVQPGQLFLHGDRKGVPLGVPFGPRARLLFAYFLTESFNNDNFEVDRGGISLNRWAERFGLSIGGKTYTALREQELRLATSRFSTTFRGRGYEGATWDEVYVAGMRPDPLAHTPAATGMRNMVRLNSELYREIGDHPTRVPIHALAQLSNQSLGLDIFFWLAYRLPVLTGSEHVTWLELAACFGPSYRHLHHFQPRFLDKLERVLSIYRSARVDVDAQGLLLHPSRPPQFG